MGFEDFDQMDTWDAGKTAGGRHGTGASKRRMSKMVKKVNDNANGGGDVLSGKDKRRYGEADLGVMEAGEKKQYEEGMSKGFTE